MVHWQWFLMMGMKGCYTLTGVLMPFTVEGALCLPITQTSRIHGSHGSIQCPAGWPLLTNLWMNALHPLYVMWLASTAGVPWIWLVYITFFDVMLWSTVYISSCVRPLQESTLICFTSVTWLCIWISMVQHLFYGQTTRQFSQKRPVMLGCWLCTRIISTGAFEIDPCYLV